MKNELKKLLRKWENRVKKMDEKYDFCRRVPQTWISGTDTGNPVHGCYSQLKQDIEDLKKIIDEDDAKIKKLCEEQHRMFSDKDDLCKYCGKPLNPNF